MPEYGNRDPRPSVYPGSTTKQRLNKLLEKIYQTETFIHRTKESIGDKARCDTENEEDASA